VCERACENDRGEDWELHAPRILNFQAI
jgi:hypothetical protein